MQGTDSWHLALYVAGVLEQKLPPSPPSQGQQGEQSIAAPALSSRLKVGHANATYFWGLHFAHGANGPGLTVVSREPPPQQKCFALGSAAPKGGPGACCPPLTADVPSPCAMPLRLPEVSQRPCLLCNNMAILLQMASGEPRGLARPAPRGRLHTHTHPSLASHTPRLSLCF